MPIPIFAAIAAAGAAAGALVGAVGTGLDAAAQRRMLRRNAVLSRLAADHAISRGQLEASRILTEAGRLRGEQAAGYIQGGVAVTSGSAQAVMAETTILSERDAQIARTNAAMEAFGYEQRIKQAREDIRGSRRQAVVEISRHVLGGSANVAKALI